MRGASAGKGIVSPFGRYACYRSLFREAQNRPQRLRGWERRGASR